MEGTLATGDLISSYFTDVTVEVVEQDRRADGTRG